MEAFIFLRDFCKRNNRSQFNPRKAYFKFELANSQLTKFQKAAM